MGKDSSSSRHGDVANFLLHVVEELKNNQFQGLCTKPNGCLERRKKFLVVVINLDVVKNGVMYLLEHSLIYKFMGILISFPFLGAWARNNWNLKGDMEIILQANGFFLWFSPD
jgi:hypothetical protein